MPAPPSRFDDLATAVTDNRARGRATVAVDTDRLADWLEGWRADRARILDAEDQAQRWQRRARSRQAGRRTRSRGGWSSPSAGGGVSGGGGG